MFFSDGCDTVIEMWCVWSGDKKLRLVPGYLKLDRSSSSERDLFKENIETPVVNSDKISPKYQTYQVNADHIMRCKG